MWVAASLGACLCLQIAATIWSFLVFALDAIAIAAQALTGKSLGAGDVEGARRATRLMIRWGIWCGVVAGVLLLLVMRWLPLLFTSDPDVQRVLASALLVVALSAAVGICLRHRQGAHRRRRHPLARQGMVVNLLLYLPLVLGCGPRAVAAVSSRRSRYAARDVLALGRVHRVHGDPRGHPRDAGHRRWMVTAPVALPPPPHVLIHGDTQRISAIPLRRHNRCRGQASHTRIPHRMNVDNFRGVSAIWATIDACEMPRDHSRGPARDGGYGPPDLPRRVIGLSSWQPAAGRTEIRRGVRSDRPSSVQQASAFGR